MRYSCFDAAAGDYRYFADSSRLPINSDLPVPKLPRPAGKVGAPAREAARPLPPGAREVGRGARAQGIVVRCAGGGLGGWWGELEPSGKRNVLLGIVGVIGLVTAVALWTEKEPYRSV